MERLRARAAQDQRSLNREAIWLLEQALENFPDHASRLQQEREAQLAAWQVLAGQWKGAPQSVDELVQDIYHARTDGREVKL